MAAVVLMPMVAPKLLCCRKVNMVSCILTLLASLSVGFATVVLMVALEF